MRHVCSMYTVHVQQAAQSSIAFNVSKHARNRVDVQHFAGKQIITFSRKIQARIEKSTT